MGLDSRKAMTFKINDGVSGICPERKNTPARGNPCIGKGKSETVT